MDESEREEDLETSRKPVFVRFVCGSNLPIGKESEPEPVAAGRRRTGGKQFERREQKDEWCKSKDIAEESGVSRNRSGQHRQGQAPENKSERTSRKISGKAGAGRLHPEEHVACCGDKGPALPFSVNRFSHS